MAAAFGLVCSATVSVAIASGFATADRPCGCDASSKSISIVSIAASSQYVGSNADRSISDLGVCNYSVASWTRSLVGFP